MAGFDEWGEFEGHTGIVYLSRLGEIACLDCGAGWGAANREAAEAHDCPNR